MRRLLIIFILGLLILFAGFYFWASSGRLSVEAKHVVEQYQQADSEVDDTLAVMTYNMGYLSGMTNNQPVNPPKSLFEENLGSLQELISTHPAHIIGFQEIDYHSARSFEVDQLAALSSGYAEGVRSVNWDKRYVPFPYWPPKVHFGSMQSGQAILSKFPVQSSSHLVLSKPQSAPFYYNAFYLDRLVQLVELKVGSQEVVVLNVHLEAFDQETREAQAETLLELVDSLVDQKPLILLGDFNARPPFATEQVTNESTMRLFYEHPDLQPAITKGDYLDGEGDFFTFDTDTPYEKLDYIFYNHLFIEPVSARVLHQAGQISDHLPVYFTFTLRN